MFRWEKLQIIPCFYAGFEDAGYKVIILLGITNSLRKQTQERIDENFVGVYH